MKLLFLSILLLPVFCKAQSSWQYRENTDKMTSKTVYVANLMSTNKMDFKFPYDGGSTANIEVDNINGHNQVLLSVSKGQFNTNENGMNIIVRFDDNKAEMFRCGNVATGKTDEIYIDADKKFITKLKQAKAVYIQAEFYEDGAKVMEFNVSGFDWNH